MLHRRVFSKRTAALGLALAVAVLAAAAALAAGDDKAAGTAAENAVGMTGCMSANMTSGQAAGGVMGMATGKVEAVAEDTYPMDTCVVTGAKLGAMGDPVVYDYEGREIRFCCAGCIKQFEQDPQKYLKKLDDAVIERDLPNYPLEIGLVTGKSLMGENVEPIDFIYHNRLVRLYDDAAVKTFMKEPEMYLKKLDEAQAKYNMEMMENTGMMGGMNQMNAGQMGMNAGQMHENGDTEAHSSCGGH
jgi:YHS domain-containing protein